MRKYEGLMIGGPKARQSLAATSTTIRFPERPDLTPLSKDPPPDQHQPLKEHVYKYHEPIPGIPFWVYQHGASEEQSLADALRDLLRCYSQASPTDTPAHFRYRMGQRLRKKSGAEWYGRVVGWYSTAQTPEGYNIESACHPGSTQLWPLAALEPYVDED